MTHAQTRSRITTSAFAHPFAFIFILTLGLLAPSSGHASVEVVTTVPDLAALAHEIGGDHVRVKSLSLSTQDPHWVDAKPNLALMLNRADLLIAVGAELEIGWLPKLQVGARNPKILKNGDGYLECAQVVNLLDIPTGPIDRSMGDIHSGGNPHYLFDPRRTATCAKAIAERLSAIDPDHADGYRTNLGQFLSTLDIQRKHWEKQLAPYRGTAVITYHKSWVYLTDWLGLVEVEHLEPKPGIPPTPTHVVKVMQVARQHNVPVILQESYYPSKTGTLVASKVRARLVDLPAGTDFRHGQNYIDHMNDIITRLERALSAGARASL